MQKVTYTMSTWKDGGAARLAVRGVSGALAPATPWTGARAGLATGRA
jgi:hypothetical protein